MSISYVVESFATNEFALNREVVPVEPISTAVLLFFKFINDISPSALLSKQSPTVLYHMDMVAPEILALSQ